MEKTGKMQTVPRQTDAMVAPCPVTSQVTDREFNTKHSVYLSFLQRLLHKAVVINPFYTKNSEAQQG